MKSTITPPATSSNTTTNSSKMCNINLVILIKNATANHIKQKTTVKLCLDGND